MNKKLISYIVFFYFKHLLSLFIALLCLIWLSQILRILDLKYSITNQLIEIITTTLLVIPSFINPLFPILILISFIFLNYNLRSTNEIIIFNQYFNNKNKFITSLIINLIVLFFYILNSEFVSPNSYKIYKIKELEIRNNLKLGIPDEDEFHIGDELSIFFKSKENNYFQNIEAILYKDNQFIKSEYSVIEYDKQGFNIVFYNGYRIKMNKNEKSKTVFEKFLYNIIKEFDDEPLLDKEHFNTIQLLNHHQKDFYFDGHSKIFQYLLILLLLFSSNKIIFRDLNLNSHKLKNFFLFTIVLLNLIINSYLIFKLNQLKLDITIYYLINSICILVTILYLKTLYDNK